MGKTCLVNRLCYGIYKDNYPTTIGSDQFVKKLDKNGKKYQIQFWDSAGDERYANMCKLYVRNCHQCIIVTDKKDMVNIRKAKQWKDLIEKYIHQLQVNKIPYFLVFSKSDMGYDNEYDKELFEYYKTYFDYMQDVSAYDGSNVHKILDQIVSHVKFSPTIMRDTSDNMSFGPDSFRSISNRSIKKPAGKKKKNCDC